MSVKTASKYIDTEYLGTLKNSLTPQEIKDYNILSYLGNMGGKNSLDRIQDILKDTLLKRGCCLNKGRNEKHFYYISIPVSKPDNFKVNSYPVEGPVWEKYGYVDNVVMIPKSSCPDNYDYNSKKCQVFMKIYCDNIKKFYKKYFEERGLEYKEEDFFVFKPECSCYVDKPEYIPGKVAASCYSKYCDKNARRVFADYDSRKGCQMNLTVCNAILNAENNKAKNKITVNSRVKQACGASHYKEENFTQSAPESENVYSVKNIKKEDRNEIRQFFIFLTLFIILIFLIKIIII